MLACATASVAASSWQICDHVKHDNIHVGIQTQTRSQVLLFAVGRHVTVAPSGVSPATDERPRRRASESSPTRASVLRQQRRIAEMVSKLHFPHFREATAVISHERGGMVGKWNRKGTSTWLGGTLLRPPSCPGRAGGL